eukprot:CAMPEP_0116883636 /NCGR_PEP_ID=MMETSP0463-20121206/16189_1 /TAXON_ID=181622 /ORGANISM="Strombidinopsis sp, Strain SopsisLIS2011" /LENGTH=88 /DNA_ID=CAMNT_0004538661 /DNA_START=212 /DNA_END=478 /DNA_ORIENTATION=-
MLEFNPNKRITPEEALQDAYFDEIRMPEQESFNIPDVSLDFDNQESSVSDDRLFDMIVQQIKQNPVDDFNFMDDHTDEDDESEESSDY